MSDQTITAPAAPVAVHTGTTYLAPQGEAPAAPPAAPVAPPAAPAAPTPAAPAPAAPEAPGDGLIGVTGDPGLDMAIEFINGVGIKSSDPAVEAARSGDFSLLEAKLAALGDKAKGYDKFIGLARQAYERHEATVQAANAKTQSIVYGAVGGEENWKAIQTYAAANATPDEKAQINAAFAAGGLQAKSAALYLAQVYQRAQAKSPGYREPATPIKDSAPAGGNQAAPLTAKAYAQAVQKLQAQARGRDVAGTPEYAALQQARLAAKRAGY